MKAAAKAKKSLGEYYSALQLRTDRWTALRIAAEQLTQDLSERKRAETERKVVELLDVLRPIELYWAFPGRRTFDMLAGLVASGRGEALANTVRNICRALLSNSYRRNPHHHDLDELTEGSPDDESNEKRGKDTLYFEVLFVDAFSPTQEANLRRTVAGNRRTEDPFLYEPVFVPSLTDALIAVMFNHNIQAVVIRSGLRLESEQTLEILHRYMSRLEERALEDIEPKEYGPELCRLIAKLRPELDVYLFTDQSVEEIAGADLGNCRQVFYNQEDSLELHLNILRGVNDRYSTPFFNALTQYARKPTGVFHAMPISRGKSITRSHWIKDMGDFYGMNIFLAETSATSGGLDSLLEPARPDQEGAGEGRPRLRLETDLLRHQRHLDLQQDRRASHRAPRRHRAGRPRLPQVAPLRHGAGRRPGGVSRQLSAQRVLDVRRGADAGDQAPPAGAQGRRQARPGTHAAPHQLHLRRHRLQRRAGHGRVPRHQARPGLPVGRSLVCLCPLRPGLPAPHRDALCRSAARALSLGRVPRGLCQVPGKDGGRPTTTR